MNHTVGLEASVADSLLQELGHFKTHTEELALLFILEGASANATNKQTMPPVTHLGELALKRAREHVGEELERNGQEELHEGDNNEDGEGDETENVGGGTAKLPRQL